MIDSTDPAVQEIIKRNSVPTLEDALILFKKEKLRQFQISGKFMMDSVSFGEKRNATV